MIKKRYEVGINIRGYIKKFLIGCILSAVITAVVIITMVAVCVGPGIARMADEHSAAIEKLNITWTNKIQEERSVLEQQYHTDKSALDIEVQNLTAELEETRSHLDQITTAYDDMRDSQKEDFELLREFWYVFRYAEKDSGITADLVRYADDVGKAGNINPHWIWSIYWKESNFRTYIDSASGSGARGLGQVMPSTGKSYYENILGRGRFTTDMLYDPYVNVDITVAILSRNFSVSGSVYETLNQYSGGGGMSYYNDVISIAETKFGITLNESNWQYRK